MKFIPPHEIRERSKLAGMIRVLRRGEDLPPILVCGEIALSGSHRLVAWCKMNIYPEYVEITNDEYCQVMDHLGYDPMYNSINDYEEFLNAARYLGFAGDAQ